MYIFFSACNPPTSSETAGEADKSPLDRMHLDSERLRLLLTFKWGPCVVWNELLCSYRMTVANNNARKSSTSSLAHSSSLLLKQIKTWINDESLFASWKFSARSGGENWNFHYPKLILQSFEKSLTPRSPPCFGLMVTKFNKNRKSFPRFEKKGVLTSLRLFPVPLAALTRDVTIGFVTNAP